MADTPGVLQFTSTDPVDDGPDESGLPPFQCELDGVMLTATKPKDALVAEIGPVSSRRTPAAEKLRLALNFLDDCLTEPGRSYVRNRLTDRDDVLDVKHVMPILNAIGDHWKASAATRSR